MTSPTRPVRVLIVDEEEPLTHVLSLALGFEGWTAEVAPDGASALDAVGAFDPDIILLDMGLPDMAGTDVAARLRAGGTETPIVFLTGRSSHDDRMAGFAAGGDDYLTKPFGLDELVARLKPIVSRLGLAPTSRTHGDLVLDEATGQAWRAGEQLFLTTEEFERALSGSGSTAR